MYPIIDLFDIKIYVFPLVLLVAVFACLFTYIGNRKKYQVGYINQFMKSLVVVLVGAAIFGRLLSVLVLLQTSHESFIYNLINGGFVFYCGVVGGLISGLIFCIRRHQSIFDLSDVVFSLLPLGQAIGRIGCYMNGCCYGSEYTGFLSVPYIVNSVGINVFPTWFVEAFFCLLLTLYFQLFCQTAKRGVQTAFYAIAYSSFRFIIEFFRGDDIRGVYGWISTSQIISIAFFVLGIFALIYFHARNEENILLKQRRVIYES